MIFLITISHLLTGTAFAAVACQATQLKEHQLPGTYQNAANLNRYRNEGEEAIKEAVRAANGAYRKACGEKPGTGNNQRASDGVATTYNTKVANDLDAGITALQAQKKKLREALEGLVIKDVKGQPYGDNADNRGSMSPEIENTDRNFKDKYLAGKKPTSLDPSMFENALNSMSTISGTTGAPLVDEQAKAFNEMVSASKEIDNEIKKLQEQKTTLTQHAATTDNNGKNLANDSPSDSPKSGSGLSGGGGGGSPGGGGGSPSGQSSSPSSLSQPSGTGSESAATSPTPNNPNTSTSGTGNGDGGSGGNGNGTASNGAPNGGATNIANLAGTGGAGTGLASTSPGPVSSGGGSSPASGSEGGSSGALRHAPMARDAYSVGGGSVGGGGLASLGSMNDGKSDGSGSSKAGAGASAAGGGNGGAGGSGSSADNGGGGSSGGDESLSPFSKPLSDPKFTLAGSETDASVKKMIGNFDDNQNGDGGRDPASSGEINDGIGERESADLFDRVHAYHERCQQKGCVLGSAKRKVGGA